MYPPFNNRFKSVKFSYSTGVLWMLVWIVLNGYLEIPIVFPGFELPGAVLVFSLPFFYYFVKGLVRWSDKVFYAKLLGVAVLSVFLSPNYDDILSRLKGFLQFSFSVALFVLVLKVVVGVGQERVSRIFFALCISLFVVTLLERFTPFADLSNAFRNTVYVGGYIPYDGDDRDLNLAGFVRPKAFTSEPSLLGLGFAVFSACFFMTELRKKALGAMALVTFFQWLVSGTPVALAGLAVFFMVLMRGKGQKSKFVGGLVTALVVGSFTILYASDSTFLSSLSERFDLQKLSISEAGATRDNESSERLRLLYPYVSAVDAVIENPFFGLGVGGKRSLELYSSFTNDYSIAVGNNAFATIFIYFGVLGGVGMVFLLISYLKLYSIDVLVFSVAAIVVMHAMGGLETPRLWVYLACLGAASSYMGARNCRTTS